MEKLIPKIHKLLPIIIALALFFIPFIWFGSEKIDLGGDSSRLYFLDPLAYLRNHTLYGISPSGLGEVVSSYWGLPYISLLFILKSIVVAPNLLVKIIHGITLSCSFLFVYFSSMELMEGFGKKRTMIRIASIIAGLFYAFSPRLIIGWDKAIMTHSQIFINPLMFFLLVRYVKAKRLLYLLYALFVSFLFAQNFSYAGAPTFFAFYPIIIIFLLLYNFLILKNKINYWHLLLFTFLFVLIHAFHLVPQLQFILSGDSVAHAALFSAEGQINRGLSYFIGVSQDVKVSTTLMGLPQLFKFDNIFAFLYLFFPILVITGIYKIRLHSATERKIFLLTVLFFLIATFLVTANITNVGYKVYQYMFQIPGFSMFRNYFGQWQYLFIFLFALLVGQVYFVVFYKLNLKRFVALSVIVVMGITVVAWDFINGNYVNKIFASSEGASIAMEMDPEYLTTLSLISKLPAQNKVLSLPLADPGYQMISDGKGGVYQGPSTIAYLAGKKDFVGYDDLGIFKDEFLALVREKNYPKLERLMSIMNIGYVFYNSDEKIYDNFSGFPYDHVRNFMPKNQKEYREFLNNLDLEQVANISNKYFIYERKSPVLPHFYASTESIKSNSPIDAILADESMDLRTTFEDVKDGFASGETLMLFPQDVSQIRGLESNYHLHIHDPYVNRNPKDLIYPLVLQRERWLEDDLKSSPDDYIDFSFLHLSKRIAELKRWSTEIPILKSSPPDALPIKLFGKYNSWESILALYEFQVEEILKFINSTDDSQWKDKSLIKLNEQLLKHEPAVKDIIKNSTKSVAEKGYLYKLSSEMFRRLDAKYEIKFFDVEEFEFEINETNPADMSFDIRVNDLSTLQVEAAGKKVSPSLVDKLEGTTTFSNIFFTGAEKSLFTLRIPSENVAVGREWIPSGELVSDTSGEFEFNMNNHVSNFPGLILPIEKWIPSTQYLISFDFLTNGSEMSFALHEKRKDIDGRMWVKNVFEKRLTSETWRPHQTIITSDTDGVMVYLNIFSDDNKDMSNIQIKNLQVKAIPVPKVIAISSVQNKDVLRPPNIYFSRINSTKYRVHVENATGPYTLIMNSMYNQNWNVYLADDVETSSSSSSLIRHFGGSVREGDHKNEFMDIFSKDFNYAEQPLNLTHVIVNGYANGWKINPADVKDRKKYTFIIEMSAQRNFYYALTISIGALLILLIMIIYGQFKIFKKS